MPDISQQWSCVGLSLHGSHTPNITANIYCGKFWKRWKYQTTWPASWEICMQVKNLYWTWNNRLCWFQIRKGVHQGCILSPCLFNSYADYIMWNAGLDKVQDGIKIAGRNINNLRYADDTSLMAESEELKSLLRKVKEESEKADLKLNIQKTKIMASGPIPIPSWKIKRESKETETWWGWGGGGAQKSLQMLTAAMKLKDACSLEEKLWPT